MVREVSLAFQGDIQIEVFSSLKRLGTTQLAAKLDSWFLAS